jgi:DNA-binding NtrC family response regulator
MDANAARHILVVEDNESYRRLITRMLEDASFRVTGAADFAAAMTVLDSAEAIDLLLTDIGMPPGTPHGFSIASVAQRRRQQLKLLYMTGAYDPKEFALFTEDATVLRKPFTAADLVKAIEQALR